jgi:hypothetical protein
MAIGTAMATKFFRLAIFGLVIVLLSPLLSSLEIKEIKNLQAEDFADPAFRAVWEKSDKAVAEGQVARPWLWGDAPFATQQEAYDEAGGTRLVQYFDKSRMELTKPFADKNSPYYVTNGLLTKELVSGQMQVGDNRYQEGLAAEIPVAGDGDNNPNCPTYATFGRSGLVSLVAGTARAQDATGQPVTATMNRAGQVGRLQSLPEAVSNAYYSPELGHNIPDVFWNWLRGLNTDWLFAMGYPISEAYWSQVQVGGETKQVLIQLFERRVLTFTPDNAPAWKVEMGNIGRHYYQWRYGDGIAHVTSYRIYKSEIERTQYVVGVFQNDSNVEQRLKLTVNLLDEQGNVLASSDTMIDALSIVPGKGRSPFRLIIKNAPEKWAKVEFSAEQLPFFKGFKERFNYQLQVAGVQLGQTSYGLAQLTGRLTNLGQNASRYSQVFAVAYDNNGKVLDVESGYTDPQRIEPGDSAPFALAFLRVSGFSQYEVFSEGQS